MEWLVKSTNAQFHHIDAKADAKRDEITGPLKKDKGKETIRDSSLGNLYSPDRTQRQGTYETQQSNISTRTREIKIKSEDIALFDPHTKTSTAKPYFHRHLHFGETN